MTAKKSRSCGLIIISKPTLIIAAQLAQEVNAKRAVNAFMAFDHLSGAHLASQQMTWKLFSSSTFRCLQLFGAEIRGVKNISSDLKRSRRPQGEVMLLSWVHWFFSSTWEPLEVHITSIYHITSYVWVLVCLPVRSPTDTPRDVRGGAANGLWVKLIMEITFILFTLSPSNSSPLQFNLVLLFSVCHFT